MGSDSLDRIVKGAPPPDVSAEQVAANAKAATSPHPNSHSITAPLPPHPSTGTHNADNAATSDPRDALPSSPPQIYLNLLILESSLRLQYLSLRARLRLHMLLLFFLSLWNLTFTYLLFFRPREDGSGIGGSVYWMIDSGVKLCWCGGLVTLCLFHGTGMYERGVRWPRKFISTTNRGLRTFNLKVVVVKGSIFSEIAGWLSMIDGAGWVNEPRINFQVVPKDIETGAETAHWNSHAARHGFIEEDLAMGGDAVRVLFLPKPFSPDFREGWDTYRNEYWERENARRASLRSLVRAREREVARREGGWFWWMGWRGWRNLQVFSSRKSRRQMDLKRLALRDKPSAERIKERKKREGLLLREAGASHSRHSSTSSVSRSPTPDPEGRPGSKRESADRTRRGSSARRPRKQGSVTEKSRLSATETLLWRDSPEFAMSKRENTGTFSDDGKKEGALPVYTNEIKAEPEED